MVQLIEISLPFVVFCEFGMLKLVNFDCHWLYHVCKLQVTNFLSDFSDIKPSHEALKVPLVWFVFLITGPCLNKESEQALPVKHSLASVVQGVENRLGGKAVRLL